MPRTFKRVRKAARNRTSVFDENVYPTHKTIETSSAEVSRKAIVSMAPTSPSLDLTVTYDYTAGIREGTPQRMASDSRSSESFVSLFPFLVESPSIHHKSVMRGSNLWRDLSPQQQRERSSKLAPKVKPSHGLQHLNTIAAKLREVLCEHQAEVNQSLHFQSKCCNTSCTETRTSQDCLCDHSPTCKETGEWSKTNNEWECDTSIEGDHWFWSQAAAATCDFESSDDHLGSVCDNEFIDQLLSQGVELESATSGTTICHNNVEDTDSGPMEGTTGLSEGEKEQRSSCS